MHKHQATFAFYDYIGIGMVRAAAGMVVRGDGAAHQRLPRQAKPSWPEQGAEAKDSWQALERPQRFPTWQMRKVLGVPRLRDAGLGKGPRDEIFTLIVVVG